MSYTLIIGNKNYSSWSMRAWLVVQFLELPYEEIAIDLYTEGSGAKVLALGGETGLVPVLKDGGFAVWDTLAIIEYLYESHPQVWPQDKQHRARARSVCAEMHAGFSHLRTLMPMNIKKRQPLTDINAALKKDIQRVTQIWENCLKASGGPWLFGEFGAADIMYAPVASRFHTYGVELSGQAKSYCVEVLAHPLVKKWMDLGRAEKTVIPQFEDG